MAQKSGITLELTPFKQELLQNLVGEGLSKAQVSKNGRKMSLEFADPVGGTLTKEQIARHDEAMAAQSPLVKSVLNVLNGPGDSIERLAFEVQPSMQNQFQGLWKMKMRLLPDDILKRIAIQDSLIAAIANTRSNQIAAFGRPQPDRFSTGFRIEPEPHYTEKLDAKKKEEIQKRVSEVEALFMTCGETTGWEDQEALNLSQYLFQSARNAVIVGRIATEMIWIDKDGKRVFHAFRPIDAGTIYKAAPQKETAEAVRRNALHMIESLKNKDLEPERFQNESYSWVQVVDGRPVQAFGSDECVCHNFYPVPDVELDGYPVTPIDTIIADVTMHINIVTHNKLYFESGRAARGMIVIQSEDVDENVVGFVRQQFNANINSVGKSWRMPIFGIGPKDQINWMPIDNSSRDMEFQYLSDTNSRVILSAFQMSPEELPGYAHLSRGTNSQALSESNSEYKLEAHRDVGIRPLLAQFQNFLNAKILPLLAPDLAKFCSIKFVGLDADTAEKESTRLQQDAAVHMTQDDIMEKVEKRPVGKRYGGQYLLSPQWQAIVEKYLMVGDILEHFFGIEGASQDPKYQYIRDPFWFQNVQLQQEAQQMQQQAQAQAQQPQQDPNAQPDQQPTDLTRSIDQLSGLLTKSEAKLPWSKRTLIAHQRKLVEKVLAGFEEDAEDATKEIVKIAQEHLPSSLKE